MKDIDLLEIAGKVSYSKTLKKNEDVTVNGSSYIVIDVHKNKYGNGLQAITLFNTETKEYVIAYQGTNPKEMNDILTDVSLVSGRTPKQFEDARKYYEKMNKKYGISYVCGNSLGGGLANYVAIKYKNVKSVTYNPAILPINTTLDTEYKNIKNYLGAHDPLTVLELAAGYHKGIPGEVIGTRDNIPAIAFLLANHVGYVEGDEIVLAGGNVPVKIDLLNGLPFSVFTNDFLDYNYKGKGKKIAINVDTMQSLRNGVVKLSSNISYAQKYLDESLRIVQTEGANIYNRMDELDAKNDEVFRSFGLDIVKIVDSIEINLNSLHPILQTIYSIVEKINSVPIVSDVFSFATSLDPVTKLLTILSEVTKASGDVVDSYSRFKRVGIPALFKDVDKIFDDGLPEKLKKHMEIINSNKNMMQDRLTTYELQAEGICRTFVDADSTSFNAKQISIVTVPKMNMTALEENKNFETIMNEKTKQLDDNYKTFSNSMHRELKETLGVLYRLMHRLGVALRVVQEVLVALEGIAKYADIPIVSWDDDFFRDIYQNLRSARRELEKYSLPLDGTTEILRVADARLEEILIAIKPYIKNAIFNDKNYQNVIIYNLASYNIYESTSVTFKDIEYQLSENEAEAIHLLSDNAGVLNSDMKFLMDQIKKGTIC